MPTCTFRDPIKGEHGLVPMLISATDHDTESVQPWSSYAITNRIQPSGLPVLESVVSTFDDGSSFTFENLLATAIGNTLVDYGDRTTGRDAQGRLDYVYEDLIIA